MRLAAIPLSLLFVACVAGIDRDIPLPAAEDTVVAEDTRDTVDRPDTEVDTEQTDTQLEDTDDEPGAFCGDGIANGSELCDGDDLRNATCETLGYAGGDLSCYGSCIAFNLTACEDGACTADDLEVLDAEGDTIRSSALDCGIADPTELDGSLCGQLDDLSAGCAACFFSDVTCALDDCACDDTGEACMDCLDDSCTDALDECTGHLFF